MTKVLTGLIGHPVSHSLSPLIHNYWIKHYGLDGSYEALDAPPEALAKNIDALCGKGFRGFNVTIPHKQEVFKLCHEVDGAARDIGAVNLVVIEDGKRLYGFNTDAFGFVESIKERASGFSFSSSSALVLGAGGASRAVCYGLRQEGVKDIYIANRTKENAEALAARTGGTAIDWEKREAVAADVGLIVNTTSLGMTGKPRLDFDFSDVKPDAVVCDIVYAPLKTDFLKQAEEKGCSVVGGIGMLLHQARPSFRAWFGMMPDVTEELLRKVTEGL